MLRAGDRNDIQDKKNADVAENLTPNVMWKMESRAVVVRWRQSSAFIGLTLDKLNFINVCCGFDIESIKP